ncbi:MAG: GlsB/YeaQ/YmgE family stress response membrane protein [Labilithrix sp.]|nr:GlsB/YeaQ/YmgE family stress response membrane protein [Labilithrix sp.]MCW5835415.1 GlsB/YeaQ/YmgE family stress response membrane protein [Labilithrix sp.]
MSILLFILFGLIVGFLARAIMPGKQSMGFVATALVGIAGSFLGGLVGNLISHRPLLQLHTAGFVGSLIGALVVLAIVMWAGRRRGAFA